MLNKLFLAVSALLITASPYLASELPSPLPEKFYVNERWLSWTTDFDIETDQYKFGHIHRKFFSWTFEYEFLDIFERLEAKARARFFSWGFTFDVFDHEGESLGIVEEKVFAFFPTFNLISPQGEILAKATMNFWGTKYVLVDPVTDEIMVTLKRPFFSFKNNWTVLINDPLLFNQKEIDPRLFILVVAFQVDLERLIAYYKQQQNPNHHQASYPQGGKKNSPVKSLHSALKQQKESFDFVEPSEEDFGAVDKYVEETLIKAESSVEKKSRIAGLRHLLPLLSSEALTSGEKSALYLMMEKLINDLNIQAELQPQ